MKLLLPDDSSVKSFRCVCQPRASFPILLVSSLTIFRAPPKVCMYFTKSASSFSLEKRISGRALGMYQTKTIVSHDT